MTIQDTIGSIFIRVERVEIKDVSLPQQLQRAMATEAEAARQARAKVRKHKEILLWDLLLEQKTK